MDNFSMPNAPARKVSSEAPGAGHSRCSACALCADRIRPCFNEDAGASPYSVRAVGLCEWRRLDKARYEHA